MNQQKKIKMSKEENFFSFDELRNLVIGTVESVSPAKIDVSLETEAPQSTAINTGIPVQFPKINGYVLIPNEAGALIGQISWLGVHYSAYPKRKGLKDFDLIDLPFPTRKMTLNPLGVLKKKEENLYEIERGVYSYPSIGDTVLLPTQVQLKAIAENNEKGAVVKIGNCPLAGNAPIRIDPNKLFGRHVAVLGNTGSGKSCSVAGIIRWSIEKADSQKKIEIKNPNTRFIILDPNGEYSNSFNGLNCTVRQFKVNLEEIKVLELAKDQLQLRVPAWMWNSYEWSSITGASSRTQRPILRQALRAIKAGTEYADSHTVSLKRYFINVKIHLNQSLNNHEYKTRSTNIGKYLETIGSDSSQKKDDFPNYQSEIKDLLLSLRECLNKRKRRTQDNKDHYYIAFEEIEIQSIKEKVEVILNKIGGPEEIKGPNEDTPILFTDYELPDVIDEIAREQSSEQFLDYLVMRIRTMLSDDRIYSIIKSEDSPSLLDWLKSYIDDGDSNSPGQITILDLSLVPSEIIHLVIGVVSRIIFEAIQRYRRINQEEIPSVIVLEEAHTFIKKYSEDNENINTARLCCQTFERIAREGRKFGLGLMLSSQRPSELSPTVLSQCNTFLLHRIVNDEDQRLVRKLVPDNMGGLLDELPVLPSRKAILTGWAAPIPVLVEMNYLPEEHQPDSQDPDFWGVWTGEIQSIVNWDPVVEDWQGFKKGEQDEDQSEDE